VLTVAARFEDVQSALPAAFVESWFVLTVGGREFRGGPETRTTIEIEIEGFLRAAPARHWGSFYGIEDDDDEIVRRVVEEPGRFFRTAEALSAYSMVPRLIEPANPLVVVGIAAGTSETLLIKLADGLVERFEVDAGALASCLKAACRDA
jgi:hypothetical protein